MENAAGARRMPVRHVPRGFERRPVRRVCVIVGLFCTWGSARAALAPSGIEAGLIANTFWLMASGAAIIWLAVVLLAFYAASSGRSGSRAARRIIIGGGVVLPVVVLTALLVHGLSLMPALRPAPSADSLRIEVSGEQWWWRVRYADSNATLANEIRLPAGRRVEIRLSSPDVIHSFWIPALAGKMDMTPGRDTTLVMTPTQTGVFQGACAEFCGASHAHMRLVAVVMEPEAFSRWLATQAAGAVAPADAHARRGAQAFLANGCGACHAIRGTAADGIIGPDLTHVGSRASLAAGALGNERKDFVRWIGHPQAAKPGALMPSFGMLPADDIEAIAAYLDGLE